MCGKGSLCTQTLICMQYVQLISSLLFKDPLPYQHCRGMNAREAVSGFLRKIRELDTYGAQLYDMRYEDSACQLGLSPGGVAVFRRNRRILFQDWTNVSEVSFKNKKLLIVIVGISVSAFPCW